MRKQFFLCLLCIFIVITTCACTNQLNEYQYNKAMEQLNTKDTMISNTEVDMKSLEEKETQYLTITGSFNSKLQMDIINKKIDAYVKLHPNVVITLDNYRDYTDYKSKLPVLLMVDQVGDIVLTSNNSEIATSSYFTDLYILMNADKDFNRNDYFMNIIDALSTDGHLYLFCTNFEPNGSYMMRNDISEELLAEFESEKMLTYNDLIKYYLEITKDNTNQNTKWAFTRDFNPMMFLNYNYDKLINFDKSISDFTNVEFSNLMEQVKKKVLVNSNNVIYTPDGLKATYVLNTEWNISDLHKQENRFLFKNTIMSTIDSFFPVKERIFTYPKLIATANNHYYFQDLVNYSISKNSINKELAWDFIKFLVSEIDLVEVEESVHGYTLAEIELRIINGIGYSVNRANYEKVVQFEIEKNLFWQANLLSDYEYEEKEQLIQEYKDKALNYMLQSAQKLNLPTSYYYDLYKEREPGIIWDDMYLYLTEKQSIEQTMQNIENKVNLWLSE